MRIEKCIKGGITVVAVTTIIAVCTYLYKKYQAKKNPEATKEDKISQ